MKDSQLQELIKNNTNENGEVNYGEISKAVNGFANSFKPNQDYNDKLKNESLATFLKENNFDDMATFKAFIKNGATVNSEQVNEYKQKLETQDIKMQELLGIQNKYTSLSHKNEITKLGITDQDEIDFIEFKVNKSVTEETTFKDALELYVKEHPNKFQTQKTPYKTTGKSGTQTSNKTQKMAWEIALEERRGIKL